MTWLFILLSIVLAPTIFAISLTAFLNHKKKKDKKSTDPSFNLSKIHLGTFVVPQVASQVETSIEDRLRDITRNEINSVLKTAFPTQFDDKTIKELWEDIELERKVDDAATNI